LIRRVQGWLPVRVLQAFGASQAANYASALAFNAVKLIGAGYLIYLGIKALRAPPADPSLPNVPSVSVARAFWQAIPAEVLNPKTALFFLAFLPQFVDPERGAVWPQVAVLGVLFVSVAVLSDMTYALVSDAIAGRIRRTGTGAKVRRWLTGGVFVALGITAAAARRST